MYSRNCRRRSAIILLNAALPGSCGRSTNPPFRSRFSVSITGSVGGKSALEVGGECVTPLAECADHLPMQGHQQQHDRAPRRRKLMV
jgi:hypothetical protein